MTDFDLTVDDGAIEVTVTCERCGTEVVFRHHGDEGDMDTLLTTLAAHQRFACPPP